MKTEFVLNIYEKKEIVKTYKTDSYDLLFGTTEDFLELVGLDEMSGKMNDSDYVVLITKLVTQSLNKLKPLLYDVFDGLTEEELRKAKVKEVIVVLINIILYSIDEIKGAATGKNA